MNGALVILCIVTCRVPFGKGQLSMAVAEDFVTTCGELLSVNATSTCGEMPDPTLSYFGDLSRSIQTGDDHLLLSNCSASSLNTTLRHPPHLMLDGNAFTWWQSAPAVLKVNVTLLLPRMVILARSTLVFRSHRAAQMRLLGSSDGGQSWRVLQYYSDFCKGKMSGYQLDFSQPRDLMGNLDALCVFSDPLPRDRGTVNYDPAGRVGLDNLLDVRYRDVVGVNALRAEMVRPYARARNVDVLDPKLLYYGLYSWKVEGVCQCYGQGSTCAAANDVTSSESNVTSECLVGCECGPTSTGEFCEECRPTHQLVSAVVHTGNDSCQACECNSHSTECRYESIQNASVCLTCSDNTAGAQCETCLPGHYRDLSLELQHVNACRVCECSGYAESCSFQQRTQTHVCTGCRSNTMGDQCEQCAVGYARVDVPAGNATTTNNTDITFTCQACECNSHSQECLYNYEQSNRTVCLDCANHTSGDNCETCEAGYARTSSLLPAHSRPCTEVTSASNALPSYRLPVIIVVDGNAPLLIGIAVTIGLFLIGLFLLIACSYVVQRKKLFYNLTTGETRAGRRLFSIVRGKTDVGASDQQVIIESPVSLPSP